jgi:hypothetical protein
MKILRADASPVENFLPSSWLSKNIKIKAYRHITFPVVYMSVKLGLSDYGKHIG